MIVVLTIALTAFSRGSFSVHLPEADMTAPEIITYYGYPVEHHTTITADGYHLVLHRIPHGNKESNTTKNRRRPVVFLQHGFVGSSAVWLMNPPSQSAGFVFADAGFDVWMGNTRGNTYSFKHNSLTRNDREYWKFTFDEVSYYDLEAMIDKVLNVTRQTHVYYVAHSEGCVLMLAKLSIDPIFSSKVAKFFALGPMTSMEHVRGIVPFFANNFGRLIKALSRMRSEFLPNHSLLRKFGKFACSFWLTSKICDYCIFQSIGGQSNQTNQTRMSVYLTHMPGGTSTANLVHWAQLTTTRRLRMYDFGSEYANMQRYGTPVPPAYEFRNISTPLYVYWSDADWLTDPRDVKRSLLDEIRPEYLAENNRLDNFNHFDFIWGAQVVERIYKPIIQTIKLASDSFN